MHARPATPDDAVAIAAIYNDGIADRVATFETRPRTAAEVAVWFDGVHPIVVIEEEPGDSDLTARPVGEIIAFAATSTYRPRQCYAGIAEFSVYTSRAARGRGAGRMAMEALIEAARASGLWKLVSRVFVDNAASRALLCSVGFREVGVYEKHAPLDGVWRDVVIVERLILEN